MPSIFVKYRFRIRSADDSTDAFVVTTERGGTLPYLQGAPKGDGATLDPLTGQVTAGSFSVRVVDAITSGTSRVFTSQLEDATFRQQQAGRKAYCDIDTGSGYGVFLAGVVSRVNLVSDAEYEIGLMEPQQLEHKTTAFAARTGLVTCTANASIGATSLTVAATPFLLTSGTELLFSGVKKVTLTADAAAGATALAVSALAQAITSGEVALGTEPIAEYVARWPNRGCLFGGPITGGFLQQPDLGGWEMVCAASGAGVGGPANHRWLRFLVGYTAPDFKPTADVKKVMPHLEGAASKLYSYKQFAGPIDQVRTVDEARRHSLWSTLVIEVIGVGYFMASSLRFFGGTDLGSGQIGHLTNDTLRPGIFIWAPSLAVGSTLLRVRGFTVDPSERSPIYWTGHPIDLAVKLANEAGIAVNSASVTAVRNAIGGNQRISIRVTAPQNMGNFLEAAVYGPFGIGVRVDSSDAFEFFTTRIRNSAGPSVTLTGADVVQETTDAFTLDAGRAIRKVIATQRRLVRSQDASAAGFDVADALDGFVEQEERVEYTNSDPLATGTAEATYTVPGMVHLADAQPAFPNFMDGVAREIFDRFGRGPVGLKTTAIRGGAGDALKLGDEVLINLPQLPNHNKRILDDNTVPARAMQVVHVTPLMIGAELELLDSGANANAIATLPTLSIAASSDLPRTVAELTVTNASTLNAAGLGVRVQVALTTGAVAASTDYAVVAAYAPGAVPSTAIRLPSVVAGRRVFARARSENTSARPSNYTSAVDVTLTGASAPTGTSATPDATDGSKCTIAWTTGTGASDLLTDVYLRLTADPPSAAVRVASLEAGSTRYVIEHLTPGLNYTASIQHRDPDTNDVSALVDIPFTSGLTTVTLATPLYPQAISGTQSGIALLDGLYGLSVWAAVFPSFVEVWEALETGVGSGTYGTFGLVATLPAVQSDWTTFSRIAPNDGLRRQLKARHTRDGATASAYTTPVTVTPWGTVKRRPLSPPTRLIPYADDGNFAATSDSSGQVYLLGAGTSSTQKVSIGTPSTPATMQRVYRIPCHAFVPSDTTQTYVRGSGRLTPGTVNVQLTALAAIVLPLGCTIVGFKARAFRNTTSDAVNVQIAREVDGTQTTLTGLTHATTGWASLVDNTLNETVTTTDAIYQVQALMTGAAAVADAKLSYVEVTVTVPDLNTGL